MYTSFYNLNRKPFQISSDPAFMWFGEKHKEALATLRYGILDNKGFLLLTGDVGTGKTTLINALLQSLTDDIICTSVPDPGLEKLDFFNFIAAGFGIEKEFTTKGTFLSHFRSFLLQANEKNKKVLLIIDESQLLTQEMLEEIRLLSNIEKTDAKLINIFFVGQNEFNEILNREQNRAVRQRLTLNYNIDPLTPDETAEYIKHRLSVAGATNPIFDEPATQEVFLYSGGFPRRINVICDHSLLSGYVNEQKIITDSIVRECAKELKIPASVKNRDINGFANYREKSVSLTKPPVYQPLPEKIDTRGKKRGPRFLLIAMCCVLLFSFAFFQIFPNSYRDSATVFSKIIMTLKDKAIEIFPESYLFLLKPNVLKPEQNEEVKKKVVVPGEMSLEKKNEVPLSSETNQVDKIHPIQEGFLKIESVSKPIQPDGTPNSNKDDDKKDEIKKKLQDHKVIEEIKDNIIPEETMPQEKTKDFSEVEIKKEILALPKEKVTVRFKYNANDFTDEGFNQLVGFTDILIMHPDAKILITGYSDSEGYEKYNQKLSEFRANIVRSFFLGRGIKPEKIEVQGAGSKNPIESNDTAWGRMMNRRVEIEIKKLSHEITLKKADL